MKIVAIIFSTIMLLASAGLGFLGTMRSLKDAKDIDAIYGDAKDTIAMAAKAGDKDAAALQDLGEKTGSLRAGAVAFGVAALLALVLLVLTMVNRGVPTFAIGLLVVAVAAIVINPDYDLGPMAPASARSLAYVLAVLAALGAGASWGASALRRRRAAA